MLFRFAFWQALLGKNVTVANSSFIRCTFRDTLFSIVHFLEYNSVGVDFRDVFFQDRLIISTTLAATELRAGRFLGVSWAYNDLRSTLIKRATSRMSIWTYANY